ncbi:MAG: hypothetical protein CML66_21040 [Rhodobacteraceae bacterium]|nr:hypothetical protein [Paracoccaceae bacterium]
MRMMNRSGLGLIALLGLVACTAEIPDSGTGFDTPPQQPLGATSYASTLPPPDAISSQTLPPSGSGDFDPATSTPGSIQGASSGNVAYSTGTADDIAADTAAALASSGGQPQSGAPAYVPDLNNPSISDENDFQAVKSRESISSDAERLAEQRAQYEVIQPTAVPQRTGNTGPNIVQYALNAQNPKGSRVYSRSGINLASKAQRACAKYSSPDQAQEDFLSKGGPDKDRLGLDPDGDGYACGWDPAPFRQAVN